MLHKTKGIVMSYIRYRESSIIVRIYTMEFGMQTYVVNGVRSSKSKNNRIALYQPLTLLDMVVYHKKKEDTIHRLSEVKCYAPFQSLPYDIVKSSLALFVAEILGKSLREEESNAPLFQFIEDSVLYLDESSHAFENFHIQFLMQLAYFLGFGVETAGDFENELLAGGFTQMPDPVERKAISELLVHHYGMTVPLDRARRVRILEMLIFFYKIHLDALGEIKSLDVLSEVLR